MDIADIAARFIIGGTVILVASERMTFWGCIPARAFFLSPAWLVLRYALIATTMGLCLAVIVTEGR